VTEGAASHGLIIRLIIQTIRRDPSGAVWTDEAPNVSRLDRSGVDQIDAEHQSTDLAVGGSNPSRRAPTPQVNGLGLFALLVPLSVPCQSFALSNGPTGIGGPVIRQRGKSTQVMVYGGT
jgi:hypothetical protein